MNKLTVINVSDVRTEKVRTDGQTQREFVTVQFADKSNPFNVRVYTRNIFQRRLSDGTCSWGATSPAQLQALKGKVIDGCAIATEMVKEFEIEDRKINKFTTVLLPHENVSEASKMQAFRALGHQMESDTTAVTIVEQAETAEETATPVLSRK